MPVKFLDGIIVGMILSQLISIWGIYLGIVCLMWKPVLLWDMTMPQPIQALCNKYETGMVSLCGLFSDTVKKKASMSQYQHLEVNHNSTIFPLWNCHIQCTGRTGYN